MIAALDAAEPTRRGGARARGFRAARWRALATPARAGRRLLRQGDGQRSRSRQARGAARPARAHPRRGRTGRRFLEDRGLNDREHDCVTASAAAFRTARPGDQQSARRQGRQPRRDGVDRPAGAAGLHHHHRDVRPLLRRRARASRTSLRAEVARRHRPYRAGRPASSFGDAADPLLVSVRSGARVSMPGMMDTVLNLGLNDETVEGLAAASRRPALRLGQLPPLHPDVCRRRARPRPRPVRGSARDRQGGQGRPSRHRARGRATGSGSTARYKELVEEELGPALSRRTRTSSCGARSAPCSARGIATAPRSIAGSTTSPTTGAPRSTSRRWCSATWARHRPPASPSPAIPRPASGPITANI